MKLDLFKLNNYNRLDLDEEITIPNEYYKDTDIRNIEDLKVSGIIEIKYEEIIANINVSGVFILPCALTLEDVSYPFDIEIEESLGNFNDFYDKNKNKLDILPFIWENIVSEVPIRVVKEGINLENVKGNGWELVSSD